MKDAHVFLDEVRTQVPPNAKVLVLWMEPGSFVLHASQANVGMADMGNMVRSLNASNLPPVG